MSGSWKAPCQHVCGRHESDTIGRNVIDSTLMRYTQPASATLGLFILSTRMRHRALWKRNWQTHSGTIRPTAI